MYTFFYMVDVDKYNEHQKETEQIIHRLRNERGGKRIGQYLITVLEDQLDLPEIVEYKKVSELEGEELANYVNKKNREEMARKAKIRDALWSMEADELLELIENFEDGGEEE